MEKNERNFCTGNSRHMNVMYLFFKDMYNKEEIELRYCSTELMLADFLGFVFKIQRGNYGLKRH